MNSNIIPEEQRMQSLLFIELDRLLHTDNVKLYQLDEVDAWGEWGRGQQRIVIFQLFPLEFTYLFIIVIFNDKATLAKSSVL